MRLTKFLFTIVFIVSITGVSAEETIYYIQGVDYDIQGRTTPFAVQTAAEITIGEELRGIEELEKYIAQKTENLTNKRQIEAVDIIYAIGEKENDDNDEKTPVYLTIKIIDTNNFIILPYPKYTSSSGLKLELRLRDYNFIGTLSELKVNLGYAKDKDGNNSANMLLGFDIPFFKFGLLWNFGFNTDIIYRIDNRDTPISFYDDISLSATIPAGRIKIMPGIKQKFVINKEESFEYDNGLSPFNYLALSEIDILYFHDNLISYFSTNPFIKIELPVSVPKWQFGDLVFGVSGGAELTYTPFTELNHYFTGPFVDVSTYIGFSKINWLINRQKGLSFRAEYNNQFNIDDNEKNKHDVSLLFIGHFPFLSFGEFAFRIGGQRSLFTDTHYLAIGGALRGIPDKSYKNAEDNIATPEFLYFNVDVPLTFFTFIPSKFGTKEKLDILSIQFVLSPFFDLSIYKNELTNNYETLYAGGAELKLFPLKFRSLFFRISAGFDLKKKIGKDNYEIFIGLGNHY